MPWTCIRQRPSANSRTCSPRRRRRRRTANGSSAAPGSASRTAGGEAPPDSAGPRRGQPGPPGHRVLRPSHLDDEQPRAEGVRHVGAATAKPPMGTTIHRDQAGVPTGLATEVFYFLPEFSVDQMKAAIRGQAKQLFTDRGTTTIYTIPFSAQDVRADLELQRAGELPLRIRMFYHVPHMTSLEGLLNMGYPSGVGDDMFRFGGMKIFVDGTGGDALGQPLRRCEMDAGRVEPAAVVSRRRRHPDDPAPGHRRRADDGARPRSRRRGGATRSSRTSCTGSSTVAIAAAWRCVRHLRDLGIRLSITPGARAARRDPAALQDARPGAVRSHPHHRHHRDDAGILGHPVQDRLRRGVGRRGRRRAERRGARLRRRAAPVTRSATPAAATKTPTKGRSRSASWPTSRCCPATRRRRRRRTCSI